MRRPGPLKDLPLSQFLPAGRNGPTNVNHFPQPRSNKRALSPSRLSIFSPAKRRILNAEGIYFTSKTPETPNHNPSSPRFHDFFSGQTPPGDAVQPLAGSSASNTQANSNCVTPPKSRRSSARISPRGKSTRQSSTSSCVMYDDTPPNASLLRSSRSQASQGIPVPTVITREMPLPPDRQSRHYPGFDTYQDTQITLTHPQVHPSQSDIGEIEHITEGGKADKEAYKENVAPRRKTKKAGSASSSLLKAAVLAPDAKGGLDKVNKALSTSETLTDDLATGEWNKSTPRRSTPSAGFGQPSHTPRTVTPADRRERRQQMIAEVDDAGHFDEDLDAATLYAQ
ncbi:hypothetical protein BV22DRAFT_1191066 [Leucogyrophana mollusca]|uniref:Uncharacterized protein n=1 Tax=Leucogyrophana mollusca TaxID=85980 RepID=A0ACB8BYE9_9AGAM|nr:hypothetical protein BV22DRAFT_1191066 [Leucogyrophana mollusca]